MSESELELPFFVRGRTRRYIDELAHLNNLCVFAGSGVTVDRTGRTWNDLMRHLLIESKSGAAEAEHLVRTLEPLQVGSIAMHRFLKLKGKEGWEQAVGNELRKVLYDTNDALGGRITAELAELWAEFRSNGKTVTILTTNYDEHIEREISRAVNIWKQQFVLKKQQFPRALTMKEPVKHLHGRVPANDRIVDYPVISEQGYFGARQATERALQKAFRAHNVLLVGSGLNDGPLLNALLATRKMAKDKGLLRIAVVPQSDLQLRGNNALSRAVVESYEARLNHFGVRGLYIDYYSQVAQLFKEVRIASSLEPGAYVDSPERYSERLNEWWRWWNKRIHPRSEFSKIQETHHGALVAELEYLCNALAAKEEHMKIELWLRWKPTSRNRVFKRWASSFSRFSDWHMGLDAEIAAHSDFACVEAFTQGRAVYAKSRDEQRRWRSFVGIPVEVESHNLTVGAVVVASMTPPPYSCLSDSRRGENAKPLGHVLGVARGLVTPNLAKAD